VKARTWGWMAALLSLVVAVDQFIKYLVETRLEMHVQVDVLPFLALFRTYNTGVAFSMFSSMGEKGLILLSLVVVAFVLYLASRTTERQVLARIGFVMIVGGAVGNLIDRSVYGHVIDYILFHTPGWSFAVFNMADTFITIGAGLVILEEFVGWRRDRVKPSND
jgi:signal peptidase II